MVRIERQVCPMGQSEAISHGDQDGDVRHVERATEAVDGLAGLIERPVLYLVRQRHINPARSGSRRE